MANKKDENSELLAELISTVQKENDSKKVDNSVKSKQARVIGVDDETYKVFVYFLDDIEEKEYTFLNKTGEVINTDDTVKVFYTSNPAKGWIAERGGVPNIVMSESGVGKHPSWDETSEYFNDYSLDKMETLLTLLGTKGIQIMASFIRSKHMPQQRAAIVRLLERVHRQKAMAQLLQVMLLMLREVIVNHQACILTQKEILAKH